MKTCVYAISLNEIKHVEKFMEHCKGADLVLVCDTGSTDGTQEKLRNLGAKVYDINVNPWRFDVPRNVALSLIPDDIDFCLSIDLDEFLQPGWKEILEKNFFSRPTITRIGYEYTWSWKLDGTPDVKFFADKIHHRRNYIWKHPCHETLYYIGNDTEKKLVIPEIKLHHHPDPLKSRGQYIDLLELAVSEDPENDRMRHYYARELMFKGKWNDAIDQFKIHLSLPSSKWDEERCASMRYIARCYDAINNHKEVMRWLFSAINECSRVREPWFELAKFSYKKRDWHTCFYAAKKCLSITERIPTYISDGACWSYEPHDLCSISAWNIGFPQEALIQAKNALDLNPTDSRLQSNLELIKKLS